MKRALYFFVGEENVYVPLFLNSRAIPRWMSLSNSKVSNRGRCNTTDLNPSVFFGDVESIINVKSESFGVFLNFLLLK